MAHDFALNHCLYVLLVVHLFIFVGSQQEDSIIPTFQMDTKAPSSDIIVLGALFPIHESTGNSSGCGKIQMEDGIQPLEALIYIMNKINQQGILSGLQIKLMVLDSCDNVANALEKSLAFIKGFISKQGDHHDTQYICGDGTAPKLRDADPVRVIGVIGGQSSHVSIQVANLLKIFRIPQISYLSTSPTLSNKEIYGYFFRTVPSDINQVLAILEILKKYQWTYVSLVYTNTEYGNKGVEELEKLAPKYNVCFASSQRINAEQFQDNDYDQVIYYLAKKSAKVVVMFGDKKSARQLMAAVKRLRITDHFIWIGSDGWSGRDSVVQGLEEVVEGAITVLPMRGKLNGFDDYFTSLQPKGHYQNEWFNEFWEEYFKCRLPDIPPSPSSVNYTECRSDLTISASNGYRQQTYLHFVRDAAYAFAYAIRDMHKDKCGNSPGVCDAMKDILYGQHFKSYLNNVTFKDELNRNFKFQKNGDGPIRYSILNYQKSASGIYDWAEVGSYLFEDDTPKLEIDRSKMKFPGASSDDPKSYCSEPCRQGQVKIQQKGDTCCWVCTNCSQYQIRPDEFHCYDCPKGTLPDQSKTFCDPIPEEYIDFNNPWAIAVMAVAGLGVLMTAGIALVFGVYNDTPVIKAAGRELSYILLTGIFLSFITTIVILSKPSPITCGLSRFFLGFCYTLCYSAVVTKTNRIARIFNAKNSTPQKTRYISPKSQMIITTLLTSLEVIVNTVWLVIYPPDAIQVYPTREENWLICAGSDNASYLVGLIYPFILIGFCTLYAIKTRKCPDGFNEARYVAFSNYTACVLWLAFVPLFFSSTSNVKRTVTLSLSLTLAAMVQLCCLFLPKIYTVLFKPEKNTKEGVMSQHRSCYVPSSSLNQGASPSFLLNGSCNERNSTIPNSGSNESSLAASSSSSSEHQQSSFPNSYLTVMVATNGKTLDQHSLSTPC